MTTRRIRLALQIEPALLTEGQILFGITTQDAAPGMAWRGDLSSILTA
jgi:hypothetical protein